MMVTSPHLSSPLDNPALQQDMMSFTKSLKKRPKPAHEPRKAEHRHDAHRHGAAERAPLHVRHGRAARRALPLAERRVRARRVQAEAEARKRSEVPGLGAVRHAALRVVDDERVLLDGQGLGDVGALVRGRVPGEGAFGGERHVLREGPRLRGLGAADEHVDGCRGSLQVRVVPSERDVVANLVELRALRDGGCLHDDAAGRVDGVEHGLARRAGARAVALDAARGARCVAARLGDAARIEVGLDD